MSWIFSQALVAAYSEANSLDGKRSAPSSGTPMPQAYCAPDKMTGFSRLSQFGMTFKPSTEIRGEELLMWFRAAFLAKTSAQPGKVQESTESEAQCGSIWHGSLAKYDLASRSWKTRQCSLLEDLDKFSETWPRWGMMRNGECWELNTPEQFIADTESGFWPTPMASDHHGGGWRKASPRLQNSSMKYFAHARFAPKEWKTSYVNPLLLEEMMRFPLEWTGLKPLGTLKFQTWLSLRGKL